MKLFLVRHGIAIDRLGPGMSRDSERNLTDEGIAEMRIVAKGLKDIGVKPDLVLASPYLRTRETATIIASTFGLEIATIDALAPGVIMSALYKAVQRHLNQNPNYNQIVLVGHEPDMGMIASTLIHAGPEFVMPFKKGAVCRIDTPDLPSTMPGTLKWYIPPKLFTKLK